MLHIRKLPVRDFDLVLSLHSFALLFKVYTDCCDTAILLNVALERREPFVIK